MRIWAASNVGRVRETNEDACGHFRMPGPGCYLLVVADGMGGHAAGEVASAVAVESVRRFLHDALSALPEDAADEETLSRLLAEAFAAANSRIKGFSSCTPACAGMGTTLTAALVRGSLAYLGHVGDSRAYLLRGGEIQQLTEDHSLVGEMVRSGSLTEEEAKHHPSRNILTHALGTDMVPRTDVCRLPLCAGDVLLLCTDGLTGLVEAAEIVAVFAEGDIAGIPARLVDMANSRGGHDNITVLVGLYEGNDGSETESGA